MVPSKDEGRGSTLLATFYYLPKSINIKKTHDMSLNQSHRPNLGLFTAFLDNIENPQIQDSHIDRANFSTFF